MNNGAKKEILSRNTLKNLNANQSAHAVAAIVQESESAFQIGSGNAPEQADGVS
jgi:hypothetical protein